MLYKTPERITINGVTQTVYNETAAKYVYEDGAQTPCAVLVGNKEYLLVRNLFGDTTAIIDSTTGTTVINFSYDPWGNMDYSFTTGVTDAEKEIIENLCAVTYRGYNYDFDTGLYYLQSRYYNPQWGRFINADDTSILLATKGTLLGSNLFAYCENNPVNKVDFSGLLPKTILQIIVVCVAAFIICDMGYGYYFNDYLSDFYGTINSDGLYVGKFAYRIGFNKHKITTVVWGSYHDWLKVASRMIKTKSSQERIDRVTNEIGELSYEMNKNLPDYEQDSQLFVWLSDALALAMYSDELVDSLEQVKFYAPYARLTDKYKGYEAIAVIYKPAVYDYLEMKVRVNSSYNVKPESYDDILSTKGYN